ncbi:S-layer homology domain-containing protein [Intestinimonas butyriciproducens]|uniref:S-layer homology domain-containing protein n=1 Tax=Intestinimonas butyriciproducens TaxID=1297617 RepID=UPI0018AB6855|nr:S-layer homology domain-containing protein [Intestinimonas butyriciproducens]MDB7818231.1 S-layer homology domain-containing protein [Intestinimonas butyriciproducens]MDB7844994.1 S-layer homology domain-containing protein [Intestinimonas butyriciproducens]MDB7859357.1 S-layer homology domain-containing protein [Intestinimonas butyriciproducens]
MIKKRRAPSRAMALILTLAMILSMLVIPTAAKEPEVTTPDPETLEEIVGIMKEYIDGESAFDNLSFVYMGWRTTGGPWQNYVIDDFIGKPLTSEEVGYTYSDVDMSDATTGDYFWVQHDYASENMSTSLVWAPQYARMEITSIKDGAGEEHLNDPVYALGDGVKVYDLRDTVNVESFGFDPTSDIYQEHYNDLYSLGLDLDGYGSDDDARDEAFTQAMWAWITEKDEDGNRVNVFQDGDTVYTEDNTGPEAELNLRAHLARDTSFTTRSEDVTDPANVSEEVEGLTGEVVYVGDVTKFSGDKSALKGKVLLCDSRNAANFTFAQEVGAISVMTTAALASYSKHFTDSARFAGGAGASSNLAAMNAGNPVVEWNLTLDQYDALKDLLDAGMTVEMNVASVGSIYPITDESNPAAQGQLTAVAEIKGAVHPEKRVLVLSHVQEPSSNDNATGVGLNVELATKMKQMIDDGVIARPDCTITFLWGDEYEFSYLWQDAHQEELANVICAVNLDMVGEDPEKTGGPMRIEKAPDPSAYYNYATDTMNGTDVGSVTTSTASEFVRQPDSHTLWGASSEDEIRAVDIGGNFINDLYMAATQQVIEQVDSDFEVLVNPFEGGSDHEAFLEAGVPAVLTWHFTDYVYHTTKDTLFFSSARELEDVGITSLATAYMAANANETGTREMLELVYDAAVERFASEWENTASHAAWVEEYDKDATDELANEKEVLTAWGTWYKEALESCGAYFDGAFDGYAALLAEYQGKVDDLNDWALGYADKCFGVEYDVDVTSAAMTMADNVLSLSESEQTIQATLTVDTAALNGVNPVAWAATLDWTLDRDGSEQDPALYPYCYTGDALENWTTWGTSGTDGTQYFSVTGASASDTGDGKTAITVTIETLAPFFTTRSGDNAMGTPGSVSSRNVFESFIGAYDLTALSGSAELATAELEVNIYDSYTRYADVLEQLEAIQTAAEANGRYFEIKNYGTSEGGLDTYYVTLSDSSDSVDSFKSMNETALTDPASLQAKIDDGTIGEYRVPFFISNIHPDECPGVDSTMNLLWTLATEDTIDYNTLADFKESVDLDSLFAEDVVDLGITGLGSCKISGSDTNGHNDGVTDATEYYTVADTSLSVEELLDNLIIIACPSENPDGRTYNSRRNANGFDLNRDGSNQTQAESTNITALINEWNPVVYTELHGYMEEFLVEPCTPPHEPNMEYDILVKNFALGAEAFGGAALATMSDDGVYGGEFDMKYQSYYTPLRDDFTPGEGWSAWDDLCTNYTPSYAMLNCGSMGYTIETPSNNEASTRLFECGMYGLWDYVMENKDDIYRNQLEFFRRGVENEDHRADMESWYVDISNNVLASDTWRVPYAETDNYFPEYYVIPVDAQSQRDPADAYEMAEFLIHNGVNVSRLTRNVTVDGVAYQAGSLVVDMYQAKRNYANAVLWKGADASASGFPDLYSESVSNFPEMRGFDCTPITVVGAFEGSLTNLTTVSATSQSTGSGSIAILSNNGTETVRAVNTLLAAGKSVGMITEGSDKGDFVLSAADYRSVSSDYTLVAAFTDTMPTAYEIQEPTLFLTGRYAPFGNYQISSGYYAQWFSEGYGFIDYTNVHSNGTSNYDVMAYDKQLGFQITSNPAEADVIVGSVALNSGSYGSAAVTAVKSGTPYIATGTSPLSYISRNLLSGLSYSSLGMEALHTVAYPSDSLTTASQAADGDYVIYTYNCGVITALPAGAEVLIQAADEDSFLAGCCLNDDGITLDGFVEAFAVESDGMDLTVFANSTVNRAHQQDDYLFVTNTIYSKCLSDEPMTIALVDDSDDDDSGSGSGSSSGTTTPTTPTTPESPAESTDAGDFTDVEGHWASESIAYVVEKGLMNGTSTTTFSPDMTLSRAMLVTILFRESGDAAEPLVSFDDVGTDVWYSEAVSWASGNGIVKGYGNGLFGPNDSITREQMATVLCRYAALKGMDISSAGSLEAFSDSAQTSDWALASMAWAVGTGTLIGKDSGRLDPAGVVTRAEAAVMLQRFCEWAA